ncbi:MAG: phytoene/squalene synthase family protein [Planctomycetota bacterium]|nr:phytoene/squalene synthase family protein [Planctomycetota bacterium]
MSSTISKRCEASSPFHTVPFDDSEVIRQNSRSFSLASKLLPEDVKSDVEKLYAWCRWCDDAVDLCDNLKEARESLTMLRGDVERIYRKQPVMHRASAWLAELVEKYDIDQQYPAALIDGMEMDLDLTQIETEHELMCYCYRAAGVVGLMMCEIFRVNDPRALQHAKSLGIAMQLTNIARDVREDSLRGRCYLPKNWLPRGVTASSQNEVQIAVKRILDLAEEQYKIGNEGMTYLPATIRPAIRIAAAVYREIGTQIRRCNYRVLQGRIVIPYFRFASSAFSAWSYGILQDIKYRFGSCNNQPGSLYPSNHPMELIMNDAKYLFYLGISLTAFMGSALFLLVMLNPKDATYATLPLFYAAACLGVGVATNVLAKRAEKSAPVPMEVRSSERQ